MTPRSSARTPRRLETEALGHGAAAHGDEHAIEARRLAAAEARLDLRAPLAELGDPRAEAHRRELSARRAGRAAARDRGRPRAGARRSSRRASPRCRARRRPGRARARCSRRRSRGAARERRPPRGPPSSPSRDRRGTPRPGSGAGRLPVAMIACSKRILLRLVALDAELPRVLEHRAAADDLHALALGDWRRGRARAGRPRARPSTCERVERHARRRRSPRRTRGRARPPRSAAATCRSALDGMQPS